MNTFNYDDAANVEANETALRETRRPNTLNAYDCGFAEGQRHHAGKCFSNPFRQTSQRELWEQFNLGYNDGQQCL